jgi:transcriptional regulator with XRE-family HTH domain
LYFELFQERLLQKLRMRMRNGELTERSLARLIGISQPHVHNVLKGARILSPEIADIILRKLGMSLLDLIEADELESAMARRLARRTFTLVPLLEGAIGPGHQWPEKIAPGDGVWISVNGTQASQNMAATRLAHDPQMNAAGSAGCIALLDLSERARSTFDPNSYYGISHHKQSYLRKLRVTDMAIYLLTDGVENAPDQWVRIDGQNRMTDIVRGKVLLIGQS